MDGKLELRGLVTPEDKEDLGGIIRDHVEVLKGLEETIEIKVLEEEAQSTALGHH